MNMNRLIFGILAALWFAPTLNAQSQKGSQPYLTKAIPRTLNLSSVTVSNQEYGVTWDNDFTVPSKHDLYTKIETLVGGGSDNLGNGDGGGTVAVSNITSISSDGGNIVSDGNGSLAANSGTFSATLSDSGNEFAGLFSESGSSYSVVLASPAYAIEAVGPSQFDNGAIVMDGIGNLTTAGILTGNNGIYGKWAYLGNDLIIDGTGANYPWGLFLDSPGLGQSAAFLESTGLGVGLFVDGSDSVYVLDGTYGIYLTGGGAGIRVAAMPGETLIGVDADWQVISHDSTLVAAAYLANESTKVAGRFENTANSTFVAVATPDTAIRINMEDSSGGDYTMIEWAINEVPGAANNWRMGVVNSNLTIQVHTGTHWTNSVVFTRP
jgi:hypothetical protein